MSAPDFDLRAPGSVTPLRDPVLDVDEKPATALDDLRAELAASISKGTVTYEVPARPGWTVAYSADIPAAKLMARRKQCMKGTEFDQMRFACIILALQCQQIERRGEPVTDGDKKLTFATPAFQEIVGVEKIPDAVDAIHRFYVTDGAILSTFEQLLVEAGYGQDVSQVDPTTRSSSDS